MTTITWSSLNIDSFLEKYSECVAHIESLFDRLCKILNHRVDETLSQVAEVELCPVAPENPVTIQAFSTILSASAAEGADFLEKRSLAVEDAVQEVIQVFVKESSFNEEEEKKISFEENSMKNPWFKAEVHLKDKKLVMVPSIDDIQEVINKAAMDIISASRQIIQWQYKELDNYLELFSKYEHLWQNMRNEEIQTFVSEKRTDRF
ncbi:hypothetical protein CEXT_70521 [Caerostris extrusa]|uniref:Uncharacterized protein n=1 Tax=Caerostris extrusa TaxID=172846 RepID=A0AAV4R202_CAEEX|nr:hypothetical protein CEXT_70521 [Caerostris extrusa]